MKGTLQLAMAGGLLMAGLASPAGAGMFYAATGSDTSGLLYVVDRTTAGASLVGGLTVSGVPIALTGMAFSPLDNVLYGVTSSKSPNSPRSLVTIDRLSGASTLIGSIGSKVVSDISFRADGTLFGWRTGSVATDLVTINLATGATTVVGANPVDVFGGGLAFDGAGTLHFAGSGSGGDLSTVDPGDASVTGAVTLSGAPYDPGTMNALTFDDAGILYGSNAQQGGPVQLVIIDPMTGEVTAVGELPAYNDAVAYLALPEPDAAILVGLGLCLLGWAIRRRK